MSNQDDDLEFKHSSAKRLSSRIFEKLPLSQQVKFLSLRAGFGAAMPNTGIDRDINNAAASWDLILHHPDFPKLPPDQQLAAFYWRGVVYLRRSEMLGQLEDLDNAIDLCQKAIEASSDRSSTYRIPLLLLLGSGLLSRFSRTGSEDDLQQGIQYLEQASENSTPGSAPWSNIQALLGGGLMLRYDHTGDSHDLEHLIQLYEHSLSLLSSISPIRPLLLIDLGAALRRRYERAGNPDDLEKTIQLGRQAFKLRFLNKPQQYKVLNNLALALLKRYERAGNADDLEQAIQLYEYTLQLIPSGASDGPLIISNLSSSLAYRYQRAGNADDLERAIRLRVQAYESSAPDSPSQGQIGQGRELLNRYDRAGNADDLEQAIKSYERALSQVLQGSPVRSSLMQNLADALRKRFERAGNADDLEQAIKSYEQTLQLILPNSPARPAVLTDLGNGLLQRYAHTGNLVDLELAIDRYEQALDLIPPNSLGRPAVLTDLGNGLAERYTHTRNLADLKQEVTWYEQALDLTPPDSPDRASRLVNLGTGLEDRYERTGNLADLKLAIDRYEQALVLTPPNSPDRAGVLTDLSIGLRQRYQETNDLADLKRAIELSEQALNSTSKGSPDRPGHLSGLAIGLLKHYECAGDPADKARAIALFEDACRSGLALSPESALNAAFSWGNWAFDRKEWAEAVQAYTYGVEASEQLFRVQLLRANKESWLRKARDLYARTAYALTKIGELQRAVEVQEQGHARLLAQILERDRADLTRLKERSQGVYNLYVSAVNRLQELEAQDVMRGTSLLSKALSSEEQLADAIRQAHKDLDAAVESIRQVPGYADFLKLFPFDRIQLTAQDAPLIYITVTPIGGMALIISSIKGGQANNSESERDDMPLTTAVTRLWIDDLTEKALSESLVGPAGDSIEGGYLGAYISWRKNPENEQTSASWFNTLDTITRWLWDVLMGQLVKFLTESKINRAVLIPQGSLMLLPLHAAWTENTAVSIGRQYALDSVAFSYVSNALALEMSHNIAAKVSSDALLAIDKPYLPADGSPNRPPSLIYSTLEVQDAASYFGTKCTILQKEKAGREELWSALSAGSPPPVWHFSCHGTVDFHEPLESYLLLANYGRLSLRDLLVLRLTGIRLAILSACETGIPGLDLPDEVISLPTGLMQAGAAGVVASLWSVNELSTALLLVHFYDLWRSERLTPLEALHQAQIWVRDTTNKEKADYFKGFLPEFGASKASPSIEVVNSLYQTLMLRVPDEREFAHPYYWAAFCLTGI